MKKLLLLVLLTITNVVLLLAQDAPQAFNYQAAVRDDQGAALMNANVGVQITLRVGSTSGTSVYAERHTVATDDAGVFSLEIGNGSRLSGSFSSIDWGSNSHYVQVGIDTNGGTSYTDLGTFQLLSVPYALYGRDEDADPNNENQSLSFNSDSRLLSISNGNSVSIPAGSGSSIWSLQGNTATYEDGNVSISNDLRVGDNITIGDAKLELRNKLNNNSYLIAESDGGNDGTLNLFNQFENKRVALQVNDEDAGEIITYGDNGEAKVSLSSTVHGGLWTVNDNNGNPKVFSQVQANGWGEIDGLGASNSRIWSLGAHSGSWANSGVMNLFHNDERKVLVLAQLTGTVQLYGTSDNTIVRMARSTPLHGDGSDDTGSVAVYDQSSNAKAGIYVTADGTGQFFANGVTGGVKSFVMPHPKQKDKEIWYACIEGPEAGAYERGTAQLENGEVFVPYSDHFQIVMNPETTSFSLTPLSADTYGLAVVEQNEKGFKVKELANGQGNFKFTWEVKAVRKGHENFKVIRDKMMEEDEESK